jgi:cation transport regulator ChaB
MPYSDISELPKFTHKYSAVLRRQYLHVFNSIYERVLKNTGNVKDAEQRAFAGAASVLKKRFKGGQNKSKESHADYFSMLIDSWLGNLRG